MNALKQMVVIVLTGMAFAVTAGEEVKFKIDTVHSHMGFKVKHLSISNVVGNFKTFEGSWAVDKATNDLTALEGTITVSSIDTNNNGRDEHLRKPDFFDSKTFPKMTFKLKSYLPSGKVSGDLTIKGITKTAIWDISLTKIIDNPRAKGKTLKQGISISGTINRKDFSIGEKYPNEIISDKITVNLELEGDAPVGK